MGSAQIAVLGALAGFTIYLGLPLARVRTPQPAVRAFLNATATGILLFLLWDVLSHAVEPVEEALVGAVRGAESWMTFSARALVLSVGLAAGLISLVWYERWMAGRRRSYGPGTMAAGEASAPVLLLATPARRLALLIAVGIGLHNVSEGLAIGQSAARGELSLAVALIVGFGLHNATEGFGISAPLAGEADRPGWGLLALLGLIAGGPTFLGTLVGQSFTSDAVYLGFLGLAAGSILYVVVQLLKIADRFARTELLYWGLLLGLALGFGTDFVIEAAAA